MRSDDHLSMPYNILNQSPKRKHFSYFSLGQCTVDEEGCVEDVGIQIREKNHLEQQKSSSDI